VGINWWESDPWLNAQAAERERDREQLQQENQALRSRLEALESAGRDGG
jgi:hypothetical protein